MELRRYLLILRRRAVLIGLTVLVAMFVAAFRIDRTPHYTAEATLYVGASQFNIGTGQASNLSGDQSAGLTRLISTFAVMIRSSPIAQDAVDLTGLARSAQSVVGETVAFPLPNTNILKITVTDRDPTVARALATGVAEAFVRKIGTLEPGQAVGEGDIPTAPVSIFERAKLPTVPRRASVLPDIFVAGLFGLLLSGGATFLVEYLDITVKTAEEAERRLELPVLGVVPVVTTEPFAGHRRVTSSTPPPARGDLGLVADA